MKIRNKTGFPQQIIENGITKIIPFDKKIYKVDDSCYDAYKDLFEIVIPPLPKEKLREKRKLKEKKEQLEKRKKKLLYGKGVKKELKIKNKAFVFKPNRVKYGKKNKWIWILISPEGKKYKTTNIKKFSEEHNLYLTAVYICAKQGKKHRGWEVCRRVKPEYQRKKK